jgi:hypothetical protein
MQRDVFFYISSYQLRCRQSWRRSHCKLQSWTDERRANVEFDVDWLQRLFWRRPKSMQLKRLVESKFLGRSHGGSRSSIIRWRNINTNWCTRLARFHSKIHSNPSTEIQRYGLRGVRLYFIFFQLWTSLASHLHFCKPSSQIELSPGRVVCLDDGSKRAMGMDARIERACFQDIRWVLSV